MNILKKSTTFLSLLISVLMVLSLSACSFNGGQDITDYVNTVSDDIHEAVNLTRELKKQQEMLDARSIESAEKNLDTLSQLVELYSDLAKIESPKRYEDLDAEIKDNSKKALADMMELKSLITTAKTTGNDALYKQDQQNIMEDYELAYSALVDLGSQVTTRCRND